MGLSHYTHPPRMRLIKIPPLLGPVDHPYPYYVLENGFVSVVVGKGGGGFATSIANILQCRNLYNTYL